jgi:hypothetical protein
MVEKKDEPQKETAEEAKYRKEQEQVFGSPEWTEKNVIPLGDRAAKLWRHLRTTHKGPMLRREWEKYSKDVPYWSGKARPKAKE